MGGFGLTLPEDPLLVVDFLTLPQETTSVSVTFEGDALGAYLEEQVGKGHHPQNCMRVWLHTHPMMGPKPSFIDEGNLEKCFTECEWIVMGILSSEGKMSCRLRFNVGPRGDIEIPHQVVYHRKFPGVDEETLATWEEEYLLNIALKTFPTMDPPIRTIETTAGTFDRGHAIQAWLDEHYPLAKTVPPKEPGSYFFDDDGAVRQLTPQEEEELWAVEAVEADPFGEEFLLDPYD